MIGSPALDTRLANEPALLSLDGQGVIRGCSDLACCLFGVETEDLLGQKISSLIRDMPHLEQGQWADGEIPGKENLWLPCLAKGRHGRCLPMEVSKGQPSSEGESILLLRLRLAYFRHANPDDLSRLLERAEQSLESVCITNSEGIIIYVNPAFEYLTGFTGKEAEGQTPALLKSGHHLPAFYTRLWLTLTGGREFRATFVNRKKNGDLFHEEKHIRPFVDASGTITHFVATGRDVSASVQTQERLGYLATHDPLTDLPNRVLFKERLRRQFANAKLQDAGFAVCILDVDRLKPVNDNYGHAAGDFLLKAVGLALKGSVREEDTVARLGGDEFGLILPGVSQRENVKLVLAKLIAALGFGAEFDGRWLPTSASIGASLFPLDGGDEKTLLTQADWAMYRAKASGGGDFRFFEPSEDFRRQEASELSAWIEEETEILAGLIAEDNELPGQAK